MKQIVISVAFLLMPIHYSLAQELDSLEAKAIMARVDSIYDSLPDIDKSRMHFSKYGNHRNEFVRGAIFDWNYYEFLIKTFGSETMDIYMAEDATEDGGISDYNFNSPWKIQKKHYPLADAPSKSGSHYLYYYVKDLLDNGFRLATRFHSADLYLRKSKSYDVRKMQPVVDLHHFPEDYSYLADSINNMEDLIPVFSSISEEDYHNRIHKATLILSELRNKLGPNHPCYALALSILSEIYSSNKKYHDYDEAIHRQTEALEIYQKKENTETLQLSAKHLFDLYYLRCNEFGASKEWQKCVSMYKELLSIIKPILDEKSIEIKYARKKLATYEKLSDNKIKEENREHQLKVSQEAYNHIKATYDKMSPAEKARVRRLFDKRKYAYLTELSHHYVRAAILEYQLLDHIKSTFGKAVHDTLVHHFQQGWYLKDTRDTTKIINLVGESLKYAILQNGYNRKRAGDKLSPLEAGPIAKVHQYDQRHSFFAAKDDSLAVLIGKQRNEQAMELANRLLYEKRKAFGPHHPAYALAHSDLAWLYFRCAYSDYNYKRRDSLFIQALEHQIKAMNLYEELHLTSCLQLSARFYSNISYSRLKDYYIDNPKTRDRLILLKQKELDITQSILGDSANEVKSSKQELQFLLNYENDIKEDSHADLFAKAVDLFQKGNYKEASWNFGLCIDKDTLSLNNSKGYVKRIWQKRLDYDHQWRNQCNYKLGQSSYSWRGLQPPIDRSITKDIDYVISVESESKSSYAKILQMAERSLGSTAPEYAHLLVDAADFLSENNTDFTEAFDYYSKAAQIYKEKLNDNGIAYSYVMARLANLYSITGNISACESSMDKVVDIVKKTGIDKSTNVLNSIIKICDNANLHSIASLFYEKKYQMLSDNIDLKNQEETINTINKWADHVAALNDTINGKSGPERAFDIIDEFLTKDARAPKGDNMSYVSFLTKQWNCLDKAGHKDEAIAFLRKKISEAQLDYIRMALLARLTLNNGASIEDITHLQEVILKEKSSKATMNDEIEGRLFGVYDIYYALALEQFYLKQNRLQEAEKSWRWPIAACSEGKMKMKDGKLPAGYGRHAAMLQRHARLLQRLNQTEDAAREIMECAELKTTELLIELVMKNLQEREQYWFKQKAFFETSLPTFVYNNQRPEMLGILYNACLLSKGLLLNTEMEIARALSRQSDTMVLHKYQNLQNNRLLLTNQLELPEQYRTINTDSLRAVILALEHDLKYSLQNSGQNSVISSLRTGWQEVEQKLSESDAAVEFISIPNGKDSIMYVALTLRKGDKNPVMTTLFEEHQLKALSRKEIYETDALYRILWQPLEKKLVGVRRLFFSPSGALHQVAVEYLPGMEKIKVFRLSSTRELVVPKNNTFTKDVALYGGIQYELSEEERKTLQQNYSPSFRDLPDLRDFRGAAQRLPVLEGSRKEVSDISNMMREKSIPTITAMGVNGSEESFKALSGQGKSIIHISTHGFYQPASEEPEAMQDDMMDFFADSNTQEDRSLSRSGLLLAGAADYLSGSSDFHGGEDGILTSKEISRLDLKGLDLVVLSACETGLGDVTSEGVYGLQRGFKKAGAQTMLLVFGRSRMMRLAS